MNLNEILDWKAQLIALLNAGIFVEYQWRAFLDVADLGGYDAIFWDMKARFDHYFEKEQK